MTLRQQITEEMRKHEAEYRRHTIGAQKTALKIAECRMKLKALDAANPPVGFGRPMEAQRVG